MGEALSIDPASCLDEQTVVDLMRGRLPEAGLAEVDRHLARCDACTELLANTAPLLTQEPSSSKMPSLPAATADMPDLEKRQPPTLPLGTVLRDTYRIVRRIGRGGMGEVYEASHARLTGRYAVKVLPQEFAESGAVLSRFRREAQIASGLQHPNIVQVIDFHETDDGRPYLVMEYLDGEDLATFMSRRGAMPLEEAFPILEQIAAALGAVHRRGIVHRDVKPQNVFMIPQHSGRALIKLVDFGLSKEHARGAVVTRQPMILGTPQYMSPEQALGRVDEVGPATDQFATAAIVYEMLTGRPAFAGERISSVLYQIVHEEPPAVGPIVGGAVEGVLRRALSKRADDRYASLAEFIEGLRAAAATASPEPAAVPARPSADAGVRKGGRAKWIVAALFGATVAGAVALLGSRPAPPAPLASQARPRSSPPTASVSVVPPPATLPPGAAPSTAVAPEPLTDGPRPALPRPTPRLSRKPDRLQKAARVTPPAPASPSAPAAIDPPPPAIEMPRLLEHLD